MRACFDPCPNRQQPRMRCVLINVQSSEWAVCWSGKCVKLRPDCVDKRKAENLFEAVLRNERRVRKITTLRNFVHNMIKLWVMWWEKCFPTVGRQVELLIPCEKEEEREKKMSYFSVFFSFSLFPPSWVLLCRRCFSILPASSIDGTATASCCCNTRESQVNGKKCEFSFCTIKLCCFFCYEF